MKTSKLLFKTTILLTAVALAGCAGDDAVQGEKQGSGKATANNVTFIGESVQPTRANSPATRTSLTHSIGNGATPYWSTGDKIWAKDNYGRWTESQEGVFNENNTRGTFSIAGSFNSGCEIHYTGVNSKSGTEVTIAANQTQSTPNDFSHAGVSGDCGTGTASGSGNQLKFRLKHKASYLCFQPRTLNKYVKHSKLIKIEVTSEDDIAGTYDFSNGKLSPSPKSSASKTITLTTGGSDGFPITNEKADLSVNGSYIVIAPGQHALTIRYWLRNKKDVPYGILSSTPPIEGTVTKTININCEPGIIYDITANLNPQDYSSKYYMWDAQVGQDYWKGHEKDQPTIDKGQHGSFPHGVNDDRWYNERAFPAKAYRSCADCPNANECSWYVMKGDPHWDKEELWTAMGYIHTGGMWFKKQAYINDYSPYRSVNGTDYTTKDESCYYTNNQVPTGRPSHINEYFYLPALGGYDNGSFSGIENYGAYWTSTPTPMNGNPGAATRGAYYLFFGFSDNGHSGYAHVYGGLNRYKGFRLWTAE